MRRGRRAARLRDRAGRPVTVNLRVEGSSSTIFEGPVTTDGKQIDKGDGPHPCDGTNGGANPSPVPTMTAALDDAPVPAGWGAHGTRRFQDFLVERIGSEAQDPVNSASGATRSTTSSRASAAASSA